MRTIHKFPLYTHDPEQSVRMPRNADIIGLVVQEDLPVILAIGEDGATSEYRTVYVTGDAVPPDVGASDYVGTYQSESGDLWHVFATKPNALSEA